MWGHQSPSPSPYLDSSEPLANPFPRHVWSTPGTLQTRGSGCPQPGSSSVPCPGKSP